MNSTAPSPISLPGRVVVFDYGEVISTSPTDENRRRMLELAGVPASDGDSFWEAYWAEREGLDRGTLPIADYWAGVGAAVGRTWDPVTTHGLWLADFTGWLSLHPATIAVLEDLVAGGTRIALLSNAGEDFSSFFRNGSIGRLFEQVFVSGELKLVKPDAAIYRHALDALGIPAERMVFIDNKAENVRGAEELGITGHVFTSADDLRSFLTSLAG